MPSKSLIMSMLTHFCELAGKKLTDNLIELYLTKLGRFTDEQVSTAAYAYLDEGTGRWPWPADIILRIPPVPEDNDFADRDFIMKQRGSCEECGRSHIGVIKEPKDTGVWQCTECYTGLTLAEISKRFNDLGRMMSDKNYKPDWVTDLPSSGAS